MSLDDSRYCKIRSDMKKFSGASYRAVQCPETSSPSTESNIRCTGVGCSSSAMERAGRHILLLVDNAPVHSELEAP